MINVHVRSFAQVREALGCSELHLKLPIRSTVSDAWAALVMRVPNLEKLAASTRAARNGTITTFADGLEEGDDIAFLPPFGGG